MGLVSKLSKGDSGWFAARLSRTESISKLYAASLKNADGLIAIVEQTQEIVSRALGRK
jgi:phosphoglucomutase